MTRSVSCLRATAVAALVLAAARYGPSGPQGEPARSAARLHLTEVNEPVIQAHSNPVYLLRDRRPVHDKAARQAVAERWRRDVEYDRGGELVFADPEHRRELLAKLDEATRILERDPEPWP